MPLTAFADLRSAFFPGQDSAVFDQIRRDLRDLKVFLGFVNGNQGFQSLAEQIDPMRRSITNDAEVAEFGEQLRVSLAFVSGRVILTQADGDALAIG